MRRIAALCLLLTFAIAANAAPRHRGKAAGARKGAANPIDKQVDFAALEKKLAQWKRVQMPFDTTGLNARQVKLLNKLVDAAHYVEDIFLRQSDPEVLGLMESLKASSNPKDRELLRMLRIQGSRYDLLAENAPLIGSQPMSPDRGLYPSGLTREQIEDYVKQHPEKKNEIYGDYTIVRRNGDELVGIPYHIAYRQFLEPAAKDLREAAALSVDKAFADFLRLRADALLSDDYYKSDLAWVDLKDPKIDVIFAPYETYTDNVLGVKTSYGAAVLVRDEAQSQKLAVFQKYVP